MSETEVWIRSMNRFAVSRALCIIVECLVGSQYQVCLTIIQLYFICNQKDFKLTFANAINCMDKLEEKASENELILKTIFLSMKPKCYGWDIVPLYYSTLNPTSDN